VAALISASNCPKALEINPVLPSAFSCAVLYRTSRDSSSATIS
jgi:hypothetical protein